MKRTPEDFADEIRSHLEHEAAELEASGMTRDDARMEARRRFGNVGQAQERFYQRHSWRWLDDLRADLRHATRLLRASLPLTVLATIILAVGIGATTTLYSVAHNVILQPLPFIDPDQLVTVSVQRVISDAGRAGVSAGNLEEWRRAATSFAELAAYRPWGYELDSDQEPQRVTGARVSANLFRTLGVAPLRGRVFAAGEDKPGASRTVVLSDSLWRHRFAGDARVIGSDVRLNGVPHTIVGVVSADSMVPAAALWVPLQLADYERAQRGDRALSVVARLRPGVSRAAAQQELTRLMGELGRRYPETDAGWAASVVRLHDDLLGGTRQMIVLLFVATALLLLIACANLANVIVARVVSRRAELALRTALGAGRGRLLRQLGTETLVLIALGGTVGLILAAAVAHRVSQLGATYLPRGAAVRLDGSAVTFTAVLMTVIGVGLTAILARVVGRMELGAQIRATGREGAAEPIRYGFVLLQLSLALVLLIDGALLVLSMRRVEQVDLGYNPARLLLATVSLPSRYPTTDTRTAFFASVTERLVALGGVKSAAVVSRPPLAASATGGLISTVGLAQRPVPESELPRAATVVATPGYFGTMETRLLRGRDFAEADRAGSLPVAIVDDALARRLAPNGNVVGQKVRLGGGWGADTALREVVGVVASVRLSDVAREPEPTIYLPYAQHGWPSMTFVVRTRRTARSAEADVRRALAQVDPTRPLYNVRALEETVGRLLAPRRLQSVMVTGFAVSALVLAVLSVYGTLAYSVTRRTRELGVRLALGATARQVATLVLRESLTRVAVGVAAGIVVAASAGAALSRYLYELSPWNGWVYAGSTLLVAAAALLASYLPARRAARLDPMIALRHQ